MNQQLFVDDSSGSETGFSVSNTYAEKYNSWREKEEYQKLKGKYGKDVSVDPGTVDPETSSSSEDEEAEELTPQIEQQFFETLSKLKQNDPEIYDHVKKFFNDGNKDQEIKKKKKKQKEKPMFLRDYEREMLLKTGGVESEDTAGCGNSGQQPSYVEEQEEIRAGFRSLVADSSDSEDGFSSSLLTKRESTAAEQKHEDEQYKIWLRGQKETIGDRAVEGRFKGLKEAWSNPKISKDEAFLRDYILSKRYLEEGDDTYVPSYDQVVHDSEGDLSEDERTVGTQEQFEHKFNFRFEEPDQEFIKRYPRTIKNSLRKKDERRKVNREEKRKRLEEEKKQKEEELKRLKTLKRKEILEKLESLKEAVGNDDLPFEVTDLDTDFDPETHDRKMQEMFGEDYYCDGDNDEEKPVFSNDEEDWDNWAPDDADGDEPSGGHGQAEGQSDSGCHDEDLPACEQPGFVMDCEFRPVESRWAPEELASGRRGRHKQRGQLAVLLRRSKPHFDPTGAQPLAEYVDQYYRLDEMANPHPFKYRHVTANDFGLDAEEILMADERDLNRWVSVKRMSQYLRPEEEQHDIKKYKAKASNAFYKQKILQSLYKKEGELEEDPEAYEPQKKKKKKRKKKEKETEEGQESGTGFGERWQPSGLGTYTTPADVEQSAAQPDARKKKKKQKKDMSIADELTDERIGMDHSAVNGRITSTDTTPGAADQSTVQPDGKKKKKKRRDRSIVEEANDEQPNKEELPLLELNGKKQKKKRKDRSNVEETTEERSVTDHSAVNGLSTSPGDPSDRSRKKKKKRSKPMVDADGLAADASDVQQQVTDDMGGRKKKRRREEPATEPERAGRQKKRRRGPRPEAGTQAAMVLSMSDARLEAFGLNPKKIRGKVIYGHGGS